MLTGNIWRVVLCIQDLIVAVLYAGTATATFRARARYAPRRVAGRIALAVFTVSLLAVSTRSEIVSFNEHLTIVEPLQQLGCLSALIAWERLIGFPPIEGSWIKTNSDIPGTASKST